MGYLDDMAKQIGSACDAGDALLAEDLAALFPELPRRTLYSRIAALVAADLLRRYESGVYYMPLETPAGPAEPSPLKVVERKYLGSPDAPRGYWAGAALDNGIGLTEQVPARYEVVTNDTGTAQRTVKAGGYLECVVRKAKIPVTAENVRAQQILDVLTRRKPSDLSEGQAATLKEFAAEVPAAALYEMSLAWPQKTTRRVAEGVARGVLA